MKRRLLIIAAGVSLVLCVAAAALMVRSAFARNLIEVRLFAGADTRYSARLNSWRGSAILTIVHRFRTDKEPMAEWLEAPSDPWIEHWSYPRGSVDEQYAQDASTLNWHFGFAARRLAGMMSSSSGGRPMLATRFRIYAAPWWVFVVVTAILPGAMLVRHRKIRRRARTGQCIDCGYDLRASPDRCPECGAPATAKQAFNS
jgi:hypothetical protein